MGQQHPVRTMPRAADSLKRFLSAASFIFTLAASGCGQGPDEAATVDHRMGFLPDSLREPRTGSLADYVLHPPAWARIHRDSLCLAVDSPDSTYQALSLEVILRNPRTGDSLGYGWTTLTSLFSNRNVSCRPVLYLGGHKAWQGPVAVEIILKDMIHSTLMASRKLVVDPDFPQLDLHTFPVRFFPDRIGMEWLEEGAITPGDTFRTIRRLVSWAILSEDPRGFCRDSVIQLRYHTLDCAPGDSSLPDADLLRCSAALDSALAAGPPAPTELLQCAGDLSARLDSALLYNEEDGYGLADLYGKRRATYRLPDWPDDDSLDLRYAEGIGAYRFISVDSSEDVRFESRIIAVK